MNLYHVGWLNERPKECTAGWKRLWKASSKTGALVFDNSGRLKPILASIVFETDGFSSKICLPARMARIARSKCRLLGRGI